MISCANIAGVELAITNGKAWRLRLHRMSLSNDLRSEIMSWALNTLASTNRPHIVISHADFFELILTTEEDAIFAKIKWGEHLTVL